jgi:LuxR family maltose regulon positive regulatory protein
MIDPPGNYMPAIEYLSSLVRYDVYLQEYRLHHLFLEFLRDKQHILSQEEIRDTYRQHAQWCVENNLLTDAAVDYEKARDYRGLVKVLLSFPRIPPARVGAFLLEISDRAIAAAVPEDEENEDFLYLRYILHAKLLMTLGRVDEAAAESREAIAKFEAGLPCPLSFRILTASYNNLGTLVLFTCRFTKDYNCLVYFERANYYYAQNPEPVQGPETQLNLGSYVLQIGPPAEAGEFEQAIEFLTRSIPYASNTLNGYLYGTDMLARAEFAYYQTDLNKAEQFARQAVYQSREKKQYEVENRSLFYLMRIYLQTGNLSDILKLQKQQEALLAIPEYLNRYTFYDIGMGRFYAQIGQTGKLALWLRNNSQETELNNMFHNFDVLVKARCLFVEKQYTLVLSTLNHPENRRNLCSFLLGKLDLLVLEAVTYFRMRLEEKAIETLETAYQIAHPNSLDMPFVELGDDMRLLAGAALNREDGVIPRSWLEMIRNNASAYSKKIAMIIEQYRHEEEQDDKPVVYLTRREREVLAGLSQGLTREDITDTTGLSLTSIKTIISTVYGKLGAVNRADAIRIATRLGLLSGKI